MIGGEGDGQAALEACCSSQQHWVKLPFCGTDLWLHLLICVCNTATLFIQTIVLVIASTIAGL